MVSVAFSICSFIYIIIFAFVYFSKTRINLVENKIYTRMLVTTIIGLSIDIIGFISFQNGDTTSLTNILIAKIYLLYYFTWTSLLTLYTFIVSTKAKKKINYEKLRKKISIVYILLSLVIFILPVSIKNAGHSLYSYGPSVNLLYTISGILVVIMLVSMFSNAKNIRRKEYIPLLVFILFGTIVMIIQHQYPDILLLITCHSMVTALMYFTIENPDMQMVEELSKNRKLTEQNFEEKTNFLFKISQDLKKPLLDITDISSNIIENTKDEIKEQAKIINNNSKQLYTYVNNALDVSKMDINNLKIVETTYNTKNFFEEIKLRINSEIKNSNKNIKFRYDISNDIPEYLQGDKTRIKQIILSVIFDSIKYTEEGFIELSINTIIKYGICRLMIEISDSGKGMSVHKINTILNVSENIEEKEQERINKLDISLPLAHKIIKTMNGSFIIKSEENKGSSFLIILDQQIKENQKEETKLEEYNKKMINEKKALIVSVDNEIVKKIREKFKDFEIINSLYGKDALEKLKKEQFEFILVDDELKNERGIEVLNIIKNITKKPIYIMLNKDKEFMSEHYIEDGFDEFIIKEKLEEQIKKLDKYL